MSKKKWKVGNIVEIELEDGRFCYARVLEETNLLFYDKTFSSRPAISDILECSEAFTIWVMQYAFKCSNWRIIGYSELEENLKGIRKFFTQDSVDPTQFTILEGHKQYPATRAQCEGLECAAVWEPDHVEDRLRDHFDGKPNEWLELMKIK